MTANVVARDAPESSDLSDCGSPSTLQSPRPSSAIRSIRIGRLLGLTRETSTSNSWPGMTTPMVAGCEKGEAGLPESGGADTARNWSPRAVLMASWNWRSLIASRKSASSWPSHSRIASRIMPKPCTRKGATAEGLRTLYAAIESCTRPCTSSRSADTPSGGELPSSRKIPGIEVSMPSKNPDSRSGASTRLSTLSK